MPGWGALALTALLAAASPAAFEAGPANPWPVPEVRVVPLGAAQRPIAEEISRRAPGLFREASRRLDIPSPSPVSIVVAPRRPTTLEASRRLGLEDVPRWAAGIAQGGRKRIVLFGNHLDGYPHRDLDGLIAHEAVHLIIHAAVPSDRAVPRWYHEGLAMVVERDLSLRDALELARLMLVSGPIPLEEIDRGWPRDGPRARMAYAQSLGLVSYAEELAIPGAPRRLVEALGQGLPFPRAFERAYGLHPAVLDRLWRDRLEERMWRIPLYFLGGMVNAAMGLLAVVAVIRVRRARRRRLAELEAQEAAAMVGPSGEPGPDVWHDR
jgi:hypothetical protein